MPPGFAADMTGRPSLCLPVDIFVVVEGQTYMRIDGVEDAEEQDVKLHAHPLASGFGAC